MLRNNTSEKTSFVRHSIIEPARFKLDGGAMYGIIPKPLWNKVHPADEYNRVDLALRLWLIETQDRVIVVDTGIGDYHDDKFEKNFDVRGGKNPLELALNTKGLTCQDVTDLVISHLHFDHVGGICVQSQDGKALPVFPKARVHLHQKHWDYAHNPTIRDAGSFHLDTFAPIINDYKDKGLLFFYNGEEGELFKLTKNESLKFKVSHGHTPYLLHPYTSDFIYMADLVPTSNHVHLPWVMGYDISPGITTKDKESFLPFIHKNNLCMIFEHDPLYWGSKIEESKPGRLSAGERKESNSSLLQEITP